MTPHILKENLESADMPLLLHSKKGLSSRVHETLWAYAKGRLSEEELENFIAQKMEEAMSYQETLETMEYPDKVAQRHSDLHDAFISFELALGRLEDVLWGEADDEEAVGISQVMRDFLEADKLLLRFEEQLDQQIDGFSGEGPVLSLKG